MKIEEVTTKFTIFLGEVAAASINAGHSDTQFAETLVGMRRQLESAIAKVVSEEDESDTCPLCKADGFSDRRLT